jgi:hypothetical protein
VTAPRSATPPPAPDTSDEAYRLISINPTPAPSGNAGRDWLMYRIAQGRNMITGYRRGERDVVTADVERIVIALNERRGKQRGRETGRPGRRPAAAPAVAPSEGDGSA